MNKATCRRSIDEQLTRLPDQCLDIGDIAVDAHPDVILYDIKLSIVDRDLPV